MCVLVSGKVWRTLSTRQWGLPWWHVVCVRGGRPVWAGVLSHAVHAGSSVCWSQSSPSHSRIIHLLRSDAERQTWRPSCCLLLLCEYFWVTEELCQIFVLFEFFTQTYTVISCVLSTRDLQCWRPTAAATMLNPVSWYRADDDACLLCTGAILAHSLHITPKGPCVVLWWL